MPPEICKLCHLAPAIPGGHVIPAFVFRAIKSDSPTGFFRNPNKPNQRLQDGDTFPLLCHECEQRFSQAERAFNNNVFIDFHTNDRDEFAYKSWLHYFMTSMAWRTLILDLPGLDADGKNPRIAVQNLKAAAELMREYLLGNVALAKRIHNHAVPWTSCGSGSPELLAVGPNVMVRRSVFGFTVIDRTTRCSGILHNLAGFMCFLPVKGEPRDIWSGTKIEPAGGRIAQPQRVSSWLMGQLLDCIIESAKKQDRMSLDQQQKVSEAMRNNPEAAALRFRARDRYLINPDVES